MTKLIEIRSIEHGVRRALGILGEDGARDALAHWLGVDRSASLLRKFADPDDARHHIQLRYAIALDIACRARGYASPLLDVHSHLVEEGLRTAESDGETSDTELIRAVVFLQAALGDLARVVHESLATESDGGPMVSASERHDIFAAIEAIEYRCRQIKEIVSDPADRRSDRLPALSRERAP